MSHSSLLPSVMFGLSSTVWSSPLILMPQGIVESADRLVVRNQRQKNFIGNGASLAPIFRTYSGTHPFNVYRGILMAGER